MSVTAPPASSSARLAGQRRLAVAALAVGLSCSMALAGWLQPDSRGLGTHRQLGLPPCTFYFLFGRRCPTCGMTTSWANLLRGRPLAAVRANAAGTLLGVLAVLAVPWLLLSAAAGRWLVWTPSSAALVWGAVAITVVTLIDWGLRLAGG